MSEPNELQEPQVTDVPEPDQEPSEPAQPTEDETAEDEAAEAEDPAQESTEAPEAQSVSPQEWEKRWKKSEGAFQTYVRAIGRIWEEDATDLIPVSISPSAPPGFI